MNYLRLLWFPLLMLASMADSIWDSVYNWLTWSNIATLAVFAIICLFFYTAIKANKAKRGHEQ